MFREKGSWIITEDPVAASGELDSVELAGIEPEDQEAETGQLAALINLVKGSPIYLLGLALLGGLLLGWIVIGWWLWPARRNAEPWNLRPEQQVNYISLVAQDYWHSGDVFRARQALAGWDEDDLAKLVVKMQEQASSSEARQRLLALADALELPEHQESLLATLFGETGILLSLVLSASPLLVAIIMVVSPLVRRTSPEPVAGEIDELLSPENPELFEELPEQGGTEQCAEETEETEGTEEAEYLQQEKEEEEEEEEEEEDWEEEWDDDEEVGDGLVADILMNIFDDDDESLAALEALSKGLDDIAVDDLLKKGQEIVCRFRTERPVT